MAELTRKYGNLVDFPALIFATVTLTTMEVEGMAVMVMILTETAGVEVMKKVDVCVLGVKKVVVVEGMVLVIVVTGAVPADPPVTSKQAINPIKVKFISVTYKGE